MTSPWIVERHPDLAAFRAVAFDWLAAREAEHNLPLGVLSGIEEAPTVFGPEPPVLQVRPTPRGRRACTCSRGRRRTEDSCQTPSLTTQAS